MTNAEQIKHGEWALWWLDEDSEVFVARSDEDLRRYYESSEEALFGPVCHDLLITDEDGSEQWATDLMAELIADGLDVPVQIATQYT